MENRRVRFYHGTAPLLESDELISRLTGRVDQLILQEHELSRLLEEERQRADAAERRADAAQQRIDTAQQRIDTAQQKADAVEQWVEQLRAQLRSLGVKPLDD